MAEGSFRECDADAVAQAAVALCDGLGTRVLSDDPRTTLADARRIVATTVGALVGADGPLPLPGVTTRKPRPASTAAPPEEQCDDPPTIRRDATSCGGALGLGADRAPWPGCGFAGDDAASTTRRPLPRRPRPRRRPKVDGDLVYFNWADYLDPGVHQGLPEGVRRPASSRPNFDSYESMLAKLGSGNQYDVIFPGAKFVDQLRAQGKLQRIDKTQLENADQVFGEGGYFDDPWYDPDSDFSVPFTVYKTGIAYRKDKVDTMTGSWRDLWNEQAKGRIFTLDNQDEALGMAALLLGFDVNTADPDELAQIKDLLLSQKPLLRGYSSDDIKNLLRRRRLDPPHVVGGLPLHGELRGRRTRRTTSSSHPRRAHRSTPTPTPSRPTRPHPGTALLFIDYLLRPENAMKNINYLGYPMPVKGASGDVRGARGEGAGDQREPGRPREPDRLQEPDARGQRGAIRGVDRGQGLLMTAPVLDHVVEAPKTPRRSAVAAPGCGGG